MPCLVISSSGPTPDLSKICGEPKAPDDNKTSFEAFTVKALPS